MNEQLIVKNFGPIKDATVDFKRVTVFIGPTGGGKSTLAKLAAVFATGMYYEKSNNDFKRKSAYEHYGLKNFFLENTFLFYTSAQFLLSFSNGEHESEQKYHNVEINFDPNDKHLIETILSGADELGILPINSEIRLFLERLLDTSDISKKLPSFEKTYKEFYSYTPVYIPASRLFIPSVEYSWAGLLRDDIGLPKDILDFANKFSISRQEVAELNINFLKAKYVHNNNQDFIRIHESETLFRLYETASGIQSVTPMLVLLEHLSRNTEQAQSFIVEEPELNLFPLAQFELVKILVEKCAQTNGKNDLVVTTHSPYVLTALNLLCYAHRIAQQDEATAKKVAKLIPRHCWIDPDQFAAYYVDRPDTKRKQQVRSIINKKTGLIEENELDTASDELGAIFDKLVRLRKPTAAPARAN